MDVRLEGNVGRASAGPCAGLFERQGLRVLNLIVKIEPFAGDLSALIDDDRTDERPGAYLSSSPRREFQGAGHHLPIFVAKINQGCLRLKVSATCGSGWVFGRFRLGRPTCYRRWY